MDVKYPLALVTGRNPERALASLLALVLVLVLLVAGLGVVNQTL